MKPASQPTTDALLEPLWPAGAPGALGKEPGDVPALTLYRAERGDGSIIVVCPGGGYTGLADHEGEPVARWLNALGIHAALLRYRLAPRYKHPAMLRDVTRAIRIVRFNAKNNGFDPDRIGILGFSAGGHLAASACTHFEDDMQTLALDPSDPIDRASSRPDLGVLLYPVITLDGPSVHTGSRRNLLGANAPRELIDFLSLEKRVTRQTPPAFLFHTADDPAVPVANSLLYAEALASAGVPFELHCFRHGRHGVGLAENDPVLHPWTTLCATWLAHYRFGAGTR